ncbi:hypothetical protein BT63DRAFT_64675 [Microthyrium microscopicum]|uniref:Cyclin-like protein n=1 Tax=Microthyrium microscopicum TaxID=703497 RepID=A0A6A6U2B1_9PEZI|nr:hypothetical protein BT63DRAFT_64675 [Microthyrium microscopicum]
MPSYYPTPSHYRLPPTPPEDSLPSYNSATMGGLQHSQHPYPQQMGVRRQDDHYAEHYGHVSQPHPQIPSSMVYQQPAYYSAAPSIPPNAPSNGFYRPMMGPILPPIRYEPSHAGVPDHGHHSALQTTRERQDRARQEPKEEKPVGGVSAKLDYEMDDMTDFVSDTSQAIVTPNRSTPPGFRKWVHQVLSATRLPSSTILLAFDYLSEHMRNIQTPYQVEQSESELHRLLTTALILGSKFLDDNTFINKSWAEVSGIDVATLNYMERSWLSEIRFHLHRDPNTPHGFQSFLHRWKAFETSRVSARNSHAKPPAINTNLPQVPSHQLYSPASMPGFGQLSPRDAFNKHPQSAYPTPSYARYDNYRGSRSIDTSPPSMPHTSPQTPEYYGHQAAWGSLNAGLAFPRGPMSSYPSQNQPTQAIAQPPASAPYMAMGYPAPAPAPLYANSHGPECFCFTCNRRYMMAPGFGQPQSVVG